MSRSKILLVFLLFNAHLACDAYAQEFREYPNGLIYDEITMTSLRRIVDSENIRYRKCDLWKEYYSLPQALCNVIVVEGPAAKAALRDVKANIAYDRFRRKYPRAVISGDRLTLRQKDWDDPDKVTIEFSAIEIGNATGYSVECEDLSLFEKDLKGTWVYQYSPESSYSKESLTAFYFITSFMSAKLPENYGRMIQYSDCMIDTNSAVFFPGATRSYRGFWGMENSQKDNAPRYEELMAFIDHATLKPSREGYASDSEHRIAVYSWYFKKDSVLLATLSDDPEFRALVRSAIDEAIDLGYSDEELEFLSAQFDSKDRTLQLKRHRIVIGGCSQDSRPRVHALQIAVLAAETVNWSIFLRAHLDIMNDRFQRMSDGSYAWGRRNTYIKELEKLDIDVVTLLMGTALRIANPSGNHYFGSISRIGRALSESATPDSVEAMLTGAIRDYRVDDFNRILLYYLYRHYIYHLQDKGRKRSNIKRLSEAVSSLPAPYSEYLVVNESDFFSND